MTRHREMLALVTAAVLLVPGIASADANKEHQQLMAEIRMLQEQQQQLQQLIGGLADTLKALNARLDTDAGRTQKAFADQKLVVERRRPTPPASCARRRTRPTSGFRR